MEAPIYTFIGEIAEPSIRGILTASTTIAAALGIALIYFLGTQMAWRNAALVCVFVPILSIFLTAFVSSTFITPLLNYQEVIFKEFRVIFGPFK